MADPRVAALRAAARPGPAAPSATKYRAAGLRSLAEAKRAEEGAPPPSSGYSGTYYDRKAQIHNDWLYRWYDRTKAVATGYRTDGRRRSDNVIDARWNVPGETPEQQSARLWHAHERGVDRAAHTMIPMVVSRNPAVEGGSRDPLYLQGGDRLIPTEADMERIMAGAREHGRERKKASNASD